MKPQADFNDWSNSQEGYGPFQVSITDKGRRCDAFHQFLKPVMDRKNLTVLTRAQTSKVCPCGGASCGFFFLSFLFSFSSG